MAQLLYEEALHLAKQLDQELLQEFVASVEAGGYYHQWAAVSFEYYDPADGISYMSSHWPSRPPEAIFETSGGGGPIYFCEPGHCAPMIQRMWEGRENRGLRFFRVEARAARW